MRSRAFYGLAVLALVALMLAVRIIDPGPVVRLRLLAFDTFQILAPRSYDPDVPVRIVDIDEASLRKIGQWPWSRAVLADLTRKVAGNGAGAIAYETTMAEPERPALDSLAKQFTHDPVVEAFLERMKQLPTTDEAFASAVAEAPVVLGFIGSDRGSAQPQRRASFAFAGDDPGQFVPYFRAAVTSLPMLQDKATGSGSLNWVPERDQIIRRLPTLVRVGDTLLPAISTEALRVAQGASTIIVKSSGASGEEAFGTRTGLVALRVGAIEVPTDGQGQLWIR